MGYSLSVTYAILAFTDSVGCSSSLSLSPSLWLSSPKAALVARYFMRRLTLSLMPFGNFVSIGEVLGSDTRNQRGFPVVNFIDLTSFEKHWMFTIQSFATTSFAYLLSNILTKIVLNSNVLGPSLRLLLRNWLLSSTIVYTVL